ncbi:polymerase delta-interacting protein 3-like [Anopheles maculipalpis]|uniref:polymerase delta-interacting protein 3-like n=1 Tax=Anopheles maculipalpis TaxID=1496333 RepID=UPI00215951F2|nr:polymerase delta-interacting protein 3-like [Anopheles maculipalpis]
MDEDMDLSLDEIIRKRRVRARNERSSDSGSTPAGVTGGGGGGSRGYRGENMLANRRKPIPVVDARMKIIHNKRAKIRDARDQLIESSRGRDARFRLQNRAGPSKHFRALATLPSSRVLTAVSINGRNVGPEHFKPKRSKRHYSTVDYMPQTAPMQQIISHYRPAPGGIPYRGEDVEENPFARIVSHQSISSMTNATRTLTNDAFSLPGSMPPLPNFRTARNTGVLMNASNGASLMNFAKSSTTINPEPDPFDQYEVNRRPNFSVPPPPLPSNRPLRSILRTRSNTPPPPVLSSHAVSATVPMKLSSSMRARLERAPNPNKSMGIFAYNFNGEQSMVKNYTTRSPSPPAAVTAGYRIVVSNLHSNVTQIDIQELFEDIGDLLESRLVRPGVAEVIYRNLKDAEKAVDAYHNRHLDGQPMNCLLVNPRATYKANPTNFIYGR